MSFDLSISEAFDVPKDSNVFGMNVLLGKIFKGSGIKLMNDKIVYEEKLTIENHRSKVGHVVITKSARELFELLEMNYDFFIEGFETKNDMFLFMLTTPYLKSSEFSNPRKTYHHKMFIDFQEYLTSGYIETPGKNMTHEHVQSIVNFDFFKSVEELKIKEQKKKEGILKFNGSTLINRYPDINKKKIGAYLGKFKASFESTVVYKHFIIENPIEEIFNKFEQTVEI